MRQPMPGFASRTTASCLVLAVGLIAGCGDSPDSKDQELVYQGRHLQFGVVAGSPLQTTLEELCREWQRETGAVVKLVPHDTDAVDHDVTAPFRRDDLLLYPPWAMGELAAAGMLVPLPAPLLEDPGFAWQDVFPALRKRGCVWGDAVLAAPLGTPTLLCYFRRDVLEQNGLKPPQTWQEYFQIADRLRDLPAPSDGGAPAVSAVAEPLGTEGRRAVFLARAAAYAKHPDNFSFLFNMRSMRPLIAQQGFVRALEDLIAARDRGPVGEELHQRIDDWIQAGGRNAFGDPAETVYAGGNPLFDEATGKTIARDEYVLRRHPELQPVLQYTIDDVRRDLFEGRAVLGLAWERAGKSAQPDASISIGIVTLPGSPQVFDATRGEWDTPQDGVNRPTVLGLSGQGLSVGTACKDADAAFDLVRFLCENEARTPLFAQERDLVPYRAAHLAEPLNWVGRGTSAATAAEYAGAARAAFQADDVVSPLCISGSRRYMRALDDALEAALTGRAPPREALEAAAQQWEKITAELGTDAQRVQYTRSMGLSTP